MKKILLVTIVLFYVLIVVSLRIPIKKAIKFDEYTLDSNDIIGQVNLNVTGADWEIYIDKDIETMKKIIMNQDVGVDDRIFYATIRKNDPLAQLGEIIFDEYGDELLMDNTFILKYESMAEDKNSIDFQYLLELNSWEIIYPVKRIWFIDWCFTDRGLTIYDYLLPKH
ncbi:MAG TPA: hypothetical protein PLJ39_02215 [Spirochaetota bacterium]|nr:hypothetical protein [Spirochaetota bacterium]